jgi:3-dehydroquinate synthase
VAIGMAIVARACGCADTHRILSCLEQFGLPTKADFPVEDIYQFTLSDKKRAGSHISLIIPERIGCCHIVPTPVENLKTFIEEGM